MKSWRLNWAFAQISSAGGHSKHREALESPALFWVALAAKLIPNLWGRPIHFRLKRGGKFSVKEFMTLYIYKEIFIDGCYDAPSLPGQSPVIIDVGANTGLFAIRMKQLYPSANVFCYEPMPGNFKQLQDNLLASGLQDCAPIQEGLGKNVRTEKLFIHKRNVGGHSIYSAIASSSKSIEIHLVDIRTALSRIGGRDCTLLKLDCEGAEYEILSSLDEETAQRIERIIFEPTPALYNVVELNSHLTKIGYDVKWNEGIFVAVRRDLQGRS